MVTTEEAEGAVQFSSGRGFWSSPCDSRRKEDLLWIFLKFLTSSCIYCILHTPCSFLYSSRCTMTETKFMNATHKYETQQVFNFVLDKRIHENLYKYVWRLY
jgi:hypothetical protein